MRRRRTRRRSIGAFGKLGLVLLIAFDLGMGAVLAQDHGAGPVVLAAGTALVFGVFLSSRKRGRRHR